jgi:Probable cobalt transporter subunit (CbtA)
VNYLKTLTFLAITIFSGAVAGTILAILNLGLVEPYIDRAIAIEVKNMISSGEKVDLTEIASYRVWQKGGAIAAGAVYGVSLSALFGIVFAYRRKSLPGHNNKKKALFLAGMLWFVLYLMVAIKYPANPPAVGDPETIYYRQSLYVEYLAISGFTALALALAWNRVQLESKKILFPLIYAAVMIVAYVVLPPNPDKIGISMDLIHTFRIVTALTIGIFWGILAIVFGSLWDRFIPREEPKFATV